MTDLKVFEKAEFGSVRVVEREGEPWFVAKALGYASTNMTTVFQAVPEEWKGSNPIATPGGEQEMLILSEQGLYFFLGRSDKPGALPFQKWLAGDVLPAIRRHGVYATPDMTERMLEDPDVLIRALTALKEERARRVALEARAEADRPKVVFAESIEVAKTSILIGEMAKLIKQATGYPMGQNRFFDWLRSHGYLHKGGSQKNAPTQRCIDAGWMEVKEGTRIGSSGECHITRTTKITGKGQIYFVNMFRNMAESLA